ncbi:MAG: DegV family protein [Chloroflexota bacterium]
MVTDSTANLPDHLIERYSIEVVPLRVLFGNEAFAEGIDLSQDEFYKRLKEAPTLPRTSQPSAGEFAATYERLAQDGSAIVSIHISSGLSGTFASAEAAKGMVPNIKVSVVDTATTSMGLALIVVAAARAAESGKSYEEVLRVVGELVPRIRLMFAVDTLEYLQKGGRIGMATAFLGSLLSVKPLLSVRDGIVQPLERVRTKQRAVDRMVHLAAEEIPPGARVHMGVLHGQAPVEAAALIERVTERFKPVEVELGEAGPVIATHTGPGVVGLAFYVEP